MHHLVQTDRALGSLASVSSGTIAYGICITNTNPYATIHSLTVTYTGEQWRAANSSAQTLASSYQANAVPSIVMPSVGCTAVPR